MLINQLTVVLRKKSILNKVITKKTRLVI
ncbi:uncharacterized protein METZ01_LOCUS403072 [marine metagenome]|uniref:Uncharacterized protein n=1 Tax=marine metagenome TaxID=408172 RepID=A0A382VWH9_9ZZZZ